VAASTLAELARCRLQDQGFAAKIMDEMLAKKLKEDKTAGRVMMIDCSSDEVSTLI